MAGTGILTGCPSTTPFGLVLGSDLPWADLPSPGNLRLSATVLLTPFIATHVRIITSTSSSGLFSPPSTYRGTLPYRLGRHCLPKLAASVSRLVPIIFGAELLDQ